MVNSDHVSVHVMMGDRVQGVPASEYPDEDHRDRPGRHKVIRYIEVNPGSVFFLRVSIDRLFDWKEADCISTHV